MPPGTAPEEPIRCMYRTPAAGYRGFYRNDVKVPRAVGSFFRNDMHELSIIFSVVSTVTQAVAEQGGGQVIAVSLRVGALAGLERESLLFGYEIATQGTPLAGSRLEIEDVPVTIYCRDCAAERTLPGVQSMRCPQCGQPSGDIRSGRELELASVEIETAEPEAPELEKETAPH